MDKKNVGIVGATGYVGEELLSILDNHKKVNVSFVSSHNNQGKTLFEITKKFSLKVEFFAFLIFLQKFFILSC